jgi:exosortase A
MNIPRTYNPFIAIVLLFTFISVVNIPIIRTLWKYSFDDGTYSHAYLIPFITLYLYFKLSETGKLIFREKISVLPIILTLLTSFVLFITANAQISLGYWLSLLALAIFSIAALFRVSWYIVFPAAFLIFIFPMWGLLTNILQSVSVTAVTYMMSFTNIPSYVEAEFITIPAGTFEIADGCSGLRYIIVSLAISSLFVFLYIKSLKKAVAFFTFAILGALLTNWIRITALIVIGDYTDMQSSLMEDHNTFGWYLYIPFMFLLFMWGNKLSDHDLFEVKEVTESLPTTNKLIIMLIAFPVMLSGTIITSALKEGDAQLDISTDKPLPSVVLYSGIEIKEESSNSIHLIYHFNKGDLDSKPTFYNNNMIPETWKAVSKDIIGNAEISTIVKGGEKALVSVSYQIGDFYTPSPKKLKIERLKKGLIFPQNVKLHWSFTHCKIECIKN